MHNQAKFRIQTTTAGTRCRLPQRKAVTAALWILVLITTHAWAVNGSDTTSLLSPQQSPDDSWQVMSGSSLRGHTTKHRRRRRRRQVATSSSNNNNDNNNNDNPWWNDPYVMNTVEDPVERQEIQSSHQSTVVLPSYTRTTGGPFQGPPVYMDTKPTEEEEEETIPTPTSRIVDGSEASPHSFFTMLLWRENNEFKWSGCGGTLISDCHVITAAHCVANTAFRVGGIFVNAYRPFVGNNSNIPFHFSNVRQVEVHPNYDETTNQADIAILHLQSCLDVTAFPPALLAEHDDIYIQRTNHPNNNHNNNNQQQQPLDVQVLGFGSMSDEANIPADTLRQVHLPFISRQDCRRYYGNDVLDDMVCAGFADTGGPDACQGDSGGGLIQYASIHNNSPSSSSLLPATTIQSRVPLLLGVVSWGVGCGRKDFPGVYIYIPYYRVWIMERICPDESAVDSSSNNKPSWCQSLTTVLNQQDAETVTAAPSSSQPQQQCKQEGEFCQTGSDCCSALCRGFEGVTYRLCTGLLPNHQQQQQQPDPSSSSSSSTTTTKQDQSSPYKRGGAQGAKHNGV